MKDKLTRGEVLQGAGLCMLLLAGGAGGNLAAIYIWLLAALGIIVAGRWLT